MAALTELTSQGIINHDSRGKFIMDLPTSYITGKLDGTTRGSAYLVSPDMEDDVFIHQKNM